MAPDREEGQVQSDVAHSGVGFKDGDYSQLHEDQKHRVLSGKHRVRVKDNTEGRGRNI